LKEAVSKLNDPNWKVEELVDWQMANILASQDIPYSDENEGHAKSNNRWLGLSLR
jgi:hypothetical protein